MAQFKAVWINPWSCLGVGMVGALAVGLLGCGDRSGDGASLPASEATTEPPQVVATTSLLCDLTQQIAESTINLVCLLAPGQDPHTYQVTPSDRQALEQADLVLYDGYNYAPSIIAMVQNSSTAAPKLAVYEAAVPQPLLGAAHDHDHDHDHDHGHDHGHDHDHGEAASSTAAAPAADLVPDPHIWHRAANNGEIARVIAASLKDLNPAAATRYDQQAERLSRQFDQLDSWIAEQVATIPPNQRKLVTTHESFQYFADAYGLRVVAALSGLSTDEKATPASLTQLVEQVKTAGVPAIFAETTTNPQLIGTVAREAGVALAAQPLFVEGPGGPGSVAPTTQAMLVTNTCTIVTALGGTCQAETAPLQ